MLTFYGAGVKGPIDVDRHATSLPDNVHWIDAFDPSPDETAFLAGVLETTIPTRDDLVEIESSSRLMAVDGALRISLPATLRNGDGYADATPVGMVVTPARVATIRFARLPSFDKLATNVCAKGDVSAGGTGAAITILEMIIDQIADLLEQVGGELDATSRSIFRNDTLNGAKRGPTQSGEALSKLLRTIGRTADLITKVSETVLVLSRVPSFIVTKGAAMTTPEHRTRLETIGLDARSLHEHGEQLANKTQFLLDTLLGLANIEQNNVFRVLTVVSVVGIPPTFFASMYGMNFKTMPEYDWTYGYPYGLTLIALSALIPAVWFKVKGWW